MIINVNGNCCDNNRKDQEFFIDSCEEVFEVRENNDHSIIYKREEIIDFVTIKSKGNFGKPQNDRNDI